MTEEEIIDCLKTTGLNEEFVVEFYEEMELFAKLVAEKEYEQGFIDGMQKQMQSSVDKAVNAMGKREWVGLTDEERDYFTYIDAKDKARFRKYFDYIEAKLKEKNT